MLKVATWNVNGIRARSHEVLELIEREQPDVLCLQEVRAAPDRVPAELREHPAFFGYWHGHKGYSGVALLLARATFGARPEFTHPAFDFENRIVTATAADIPPCVRKRCRRNRVQRWPDFQQNYGGRESNVIRCLGLTLQSFEKK